MKRIEITVDPKGLTKVETKGFEGSSCLDASKFIVQALGKQESLKKTAEFFQPINNEQEAKAGN